MKANIYYITYSSIPSELPSSLQIIKTCEGLTKNKNIVTLIKPGTGIKKITIRKFYDLKENINIKEFKVLKIFQVVLNFIYTVFIVFFTF